MGSISQNFQSARRSTANTICIIGAGPSGLAAAKYLQAERAFGRIVIFEQLGTVGGVWNYVPCSDDDTRIGLRIPNTRPFQSLNEDAVVRQRRSGRENGKARENDGEVKFMTPIYDRLETNIPRGLMGFSDLDWPEQCQLFPKHEEVLEYIKVYSEDVRHLVEFDTQVLDVRLDHDERWIVTTRPVGRDSNGDSFEKRKEVFDAVVVANGHFNVPFVPSVPGMEEWNAAYPGTISHSKFYRTPEDYAGKKVIVVGNSASGVDIGAQIVTACKHPLLMSQKSESYLQPDSTPDQVRKPQITEYVTQERSVRFSDGTVETDIDAVLYCTGYLYSYPFLTSLDPPLVTTGEHVHNLYQHIFYRPHPTLAFPVLNQKVIPFQVAEAQSAVIARVFSGRLDLPSVEEMRDWERRTFVESGGGRNLHVLKFPDDADYINMLYEWAVGARGEVRSDERCTRRQVANGSATLLGTNGIEKSVAVGKEPPHWGEKEYWTRERFPSIKKAFQELGEDRHSTRSLEGVGFDFQAWKREKEEEMR